MRLEDRLIYCNLLVDGCSFLRRGLIRISRRWQTAKLHQAGHQHATQDSFGISAQAALMVAKRRGWPRRFPNAYGERARVLMPDDAAVQPRTPTERGTFADRMSGSLNGERVNARALEQAIEALREQLGIANGRADRAEQRVDELLFALADARTAVMITSGEAGRCAPRPPSGAAGGCCGSWAGRY
jgi:hypothetical protein